MRKVIVSGQQVTKEINRLKKEGQNGWLATLISQFRIYNALRWKIVKWKWFYDNLLLLTSSMNPEKNSLEDSEGELEILVKDLDSGSKARVDETDF